VSVPTIASLCAALPRVLVPAPGFDAVDRTISAVHVSELADPTEYLSGGELLLTTGLSLTDDPDQSTAYVARLVAAGVSALGIGLGPSLSIVPGHVLDTCREQGLCLLVVPPDAAFLTVSKAYWEARSRSTRQELTDAITAHRSLVDAMASRDPVGETLKALSRAIGAWCARLDPDGTVEHVFPGARVTDAMAVADQIADLRVAGIHSSATFPLHDEIVAVFPLPLAEQVVGYIAVGSTSPLLPTARRLVLTAGALLSLDSVQRQRSDAARQAQLQAVSTLLDMGHVEPGRRLASRMGLAPVGDAVRVLVVGSPRAADVTEAVQSWMPQAMPGPFEAGISWFVLPALTPDVETLTAGLRRVDARVTAVLSDTVAPGAVHGVRVGLARAAAALTPGTVATPHDHSPGAERLRVGVHRVLDHRRTDLSTTLVAYLRHRGQWDAAAREAGVHRNTVRHRLTTIRALLGADPDDPDVAAEVWLYLRGNGLA
jgi:purine catabolism regulator